MFLRRDNWPWPRKPEKITARRLHLRHKKVVIGREVEGIGEVDGELHFSPGDGALAPVVMLGSGWMPLRTELAAVKLEFKSVVCTVKPPPAVLVRSVRATSDGEFTRVGTVPDGGLTESFGNTR